MHLHHFLVFDRYLVIKKGVLLVNVDFAGAPDAVRMPFNEDSGACAESLTVACSDWYSDVRLRRGDPEEDCLRPHRAFAVYNLLPEPDEVEKDCGKTVFEAILYRLETGIIMAKYEDGIDYSTRDRDIYFAVPECDKTIEQIKADHAVFANDHQVDSAIFAIVDVDWKERGLLLVRLTGNGGEADAFRHRGPKTGELLNWIWVGLMTWEEAEVEEEIEFPEGAQHSAAI